jgi:hypothetical protein
VLRGAGRSAEAVLVYRRWLERHPAEHGVRFELVQLLESMDRDHEALEIAREGAARVPQEGESHLLYGIALSARQPRQALAEFRTAETRCSRAFRKSKSAHAS